MIENCLTNNTKGVGNLKSSAVSTLSNPGIALKTSIVAFEESNTYSFPKPIFIFAEKTFNSNHWISYAWYTHEK